MMNKQFKSWKSCDTAHLKWYWKHCQTCLFSADYDVCVPLFFVCSLSIFWIIPQPLPRQYFPFHFAACVGKYVYWYIVLYTEDISLYKHRHPRRRYLRRLFPVCITVLWVFGSYTDRQLLTDRTFIQTGKSRLNWWRQGGGVSMLL